jgi:redox-sensitive bicupin YhaK (pirin superfamily)
MKNYTLIKSEDRGHADHGWLKSYHSFSFAHYYNPDKIHFGALRVLNDDFVEGGKGFGKHPHDNMEIISIALEGDLEHADSMGNKTVISQGDIQVMSAGTGVFHSEYNKNTDKPVKFLQIWVYPKVKNIAPRYDQITLVKEDRRNHLQQVLSPSPEDAGVWIHQDAWFHMGLFDKGFTSTYKVKNESNGIYAFVLKGNWDIDGNKLAQRDALEITGTEQIQLTAETEDAEILLMEVPMKL